MKKVSRCRRPLALLLKLCSFNISEGIEFNGRDFHRMLNFAIESLMIFKYFHSIEIIGMEERVHGFANFPRKNSRFLNSSC